MIQENLAIALILGPFLVFLSMRFIDGVAGTLYEQWFRYVFAVDAVEYSAAKNPYGAGAVAAFEAFTALRDWTLSNRAEDAIAALNSGQCFWWRGTFGDHGYWSPGEVKSVLPEQGFDRPYLYLKCRGTA